MNPFKDLFSADLLRSLERNRELMNNSALQQIVDLHHTSRAINHWDSLLRSSEVYSPAILKALEEAKSLGSFESLSVLRDFDHRISSLRQSSWGSLVQELSEMRWPRSAPVWDAFSSTSSYFVAAKGALELTRYLKGNVHVRDFSSSFLADLLQHIPELEDETDSESVDKYIRDTEKWFALVQEKLRELTPSSISFLSMLNFLLALFYFWYPLHEAARSEKRITELVSRTQSEILKAIEDLKPNETSEIYYSVSRQVSVKPRPRPKTRTIRQLIPGQPVMLIERRGKWIYIEYFDYLDAVTERGWVLKKYLRRETRAKLSGQSRVTGRRSVSSELRGIARPKGPVPTDKEIKEDYVHYLSEKYSR